MAIRAIPMFHLGTQFRSTLEADWANTLEFYGIAWEYEPLAVNIHDRIKYLPDFHLPHLRIWAEVKGPQDTNIEKAIEFQHALDQQIPGEFEFERQLVIVLRPSQYGMCQWEGTTRDQHIVFVKCPNCQRFGFMDQNGPWGCRHMCLNKTNKFWLEPGGDRFFSGDLPWIPVQRRIGGSAR
jgi:hypothetical protein